MYDIIIVGGGPAGLSAALYALRAEKSVLILEKNNFGGQIATSPRVENYPGVAEVSGLELTETMLEQVTGRGGEIDFCDVIGVSRQGDGRFTVAGADGNAYEARAVILATGARRRPLGLAREEELTGNGLSYCAVCDGAFYKGRSVAVVGGGSAAVQDALLLADICGRVYLVHRRESFRAEAAAVSQLKKRGNIELVLGSRPVELLGADGVDGLAVEAANGERRELRVEGVFVAIGFEAQNAAFSAAAELDAGGWFDAPESCRTRTPGLFVAGDCRAKEIRQLTTAAADGAVAALAAVRYLS